MSYLAVVTSVGTRDEARHLARALVESGLVACAQISEIESFYRWDGALHDEKEFRLLCKTTSARYDDVERRIRELHSYDVPAIHAYPIPHLHAPYAAWVDEQCRGA